MNEIVENPIVEFFAWYNLHDLPIDGLVFDFQTQSITFILDDCDRDSRDVELRLVLKKVTKYVFDYPAEDFLFEMRAIYEARLIKQESESYELVLLIDMPKRDQSQRPIEYAVGKMLIGFSDMEVIGGLSREAMEYKWKVEE